MNASDLRVVANKSDITVTRPNTDFAVTYLRDRGGRLLYAPEVMNLKVDAPTAAFLAQAWKATYAKARELGWI